MGMNSPPIKRTIVARFPSWMLLIVPIALLVAGGLCVGADSRFGAFDAAGMRLAAHGHGPQADEFFRAITWFGSILVLAPLALVHAIVAWRHINSTAAFFLPTSLAGASLMAYLVKISAARDRPEVVSLIDMPTDASFPSAHTLQASAFALAWLMTPSRSRHPTAIEILLATALVVLVAWSRLHLQVHYPTDILFALAAGVIWVVGLSLLPVWRKTT